MKKTALVLLIVMLGAMLASCGQSYDYAHEAATEGYGSYYYDEADYDEADYDDADYESAAPSAEKPSNKVIYSGSMTVYTSDVDKTQALISQKIASYGGYIASFERDDSSYVSISARVPAENFSKMLDDEEIADGNSVSKSMSSEDVTLAYSDAEAELESLRVQEERLMEYLKSAKSVSDLMEIEDSLQRVRGEIATYEKRLKYLDSYISYSELDIYIRARYSSPEERASFGERIGYAFSEMGGGVVSGLQNLVIGLILAIPAIIILGIIALIVVLIVKKNRKKTKAPVQMQQIPPENKQQ